MAVFGQMPNLKDSNPQSDFPTGSRLELVSYGRMTAVGEQATKRRYADVLAEHASRTIAQRDSGATRMEGVKVPRVAVGAVDGADRHSRKGLRRGK